MRNRTNAGLHETRRAMKGLEWTAASQYHRKTWQFLVRWATCRKMFFQQFADLLNTPDDTGVVPATAEICLHGSTDDFPFVGAHFFIDSPVSDDFDIAVGQQQ